MKPRSVDDSSAPRSSHCYAATDLAQHLSQLAAWAQPEQPGELVEASVVVTEAKAIYAKAERQWMVLASIDREIAYQMETARIHKFHGLVNTLQDLRNKLAAAMSA